MSDKEFLQWIHDRLALVHGENESLDYMWKLRSIISSTQIDKITPNVAREYDGIKQ
jgi:hypothetical protein